MITQDFSRIIIEHYNETKPDFLRWIVKNDLMSLVKEIETKSEIARELTFRYKDETELYDIEINELVHNYLAPIKELPTETVQELSENEINKILKRLEKLKRVDDKIYLLTEKKILEKIKAETTSEPEIKQNDINSGSNNELFFKGMESALFHIESGAKKFVDFAVIMIDELGNNIIPYLKSYYLGVKNLPGINSEGMDKASFVEDFDINKLISKKNIIGE
jgi:hypothetical protein